MKCLIYLLIALAWVILIGIRIHGYKLTEGELLINYWAEYLLATLTMAAALIINQKQEAK